MSLKRAKKRMGIKTRKTHKAPEPKEPALLSLKDHLLELQGRLFSTVFIFIIIAAAAYPFFDKIAAWLMAPLRDGQDLVYLTPGGAFSFIIKVCAYVGLIGALPMIIYHIYRFIMPAVQKVRLRLALGFTTASVVLAICGILFAYYVSLPAALYFLTGFELNHINPMLTIDSYFSFVMTYMLVGAALFQIPLLMAIINTVTPLTPKKLMGAQKYIVLGSFIIAAIVSPTPDALNQTLLASPMIVMYQLGIFIVWRVNARNQKRQIVASSPANQLDYLEIPDEITSPPISTLDMTATESTPAPATLTQPTTPVTKRRSMDIMPPRRTHQQRKDIVVPQRSYQFTDIVSRSMSSANNTTTSRPHQPGQTIDGIIRQ